MVLTDSREQGRGLTTSSERKLAKSSLPGGPVRASIIVSRPRTALASRRPIRRLLGLKFSSEPLLGTHASNRAPNGRRRRRARQGWVCENFQVPDVTEISVMARHWRLLIRHDPVKDYNCLLIVGTGWVFCFLSGRSCAEVRKHLL